MKYTLYSLKCTVYNGIYDQCIHCIQLYTIYTSPIGESNQIRKVTKYGQYPNTDTLGVSETINTLKIVNE